MSLTDFTTHAVGMSCFKWFKTKPLISVNRNPSDLNKEFFGTTLTQRQLKG